MDCVPLDDMLLSSPEDTFLMSASGKCTVSIVINALILGLVIFATSNSIFHFFDVTPYEASPNVYLFFTNWSTALAALSAAGALFCIFKGIRFPRLLMLMKYASTMMLTVTFLIVVFLLCPTSGWHLLLDIEASIMSHLFVPILVAVDFLFLIDADAPVRKDAVLTLVPSVVYFVFIITFLLISGNDDLAPYPFLKIHSQPLYVTILVPLVLIVFEYLISYGYGRLVRRTNPNMSEVA